MAEYTAALPQAVPAGQDVLFTEEPVRGNCCIMHRDGSGIVTLQGRGSQCRALYRVEYSGNIALPTGGTPGEISLAIAVQGEALPASEGRATPAAVEQYANVAMSAVVSVPRCCCYPISVQNTSGVPIDVANSNLIVTRIA